MESIRYWLNIQLRRLGQYILRNELASAKTFLYKLNDQAAERARINGQLHEDIVQMRNRVRHIRKWLEHRHTPDNSHRFMFDYILNGHEPTAGRLTATQGVHPCSRWGIRDFDPTGDSYES